MRSETNIPTRTSNAERRGSAHARPRVRCARQCMYAAGGAGGRIASPASSSAIENQRAIFSTPLSAQRGSQSASARSAASLRVDCRWASACRSRASSFMGPHAQRQRVSSGWQVSHIRKRISMSKCTRPSARKPAAASTSRHDCRRHRAPSSASAHGCSHLRIAVSTIRAASMSRVPASVWASASASVAPFRAA
ncbi:hypothetical protein BURPS1710b_A2048 [Burkholderia pseudomallei 1710b]|uniref:Uncharacterized protein n=1 Tax=Burkholderia pseudomallei (strain 1710b) TaxID=320372 RepID=Q3JGV3_BURP1|nr:hypothetical protein BURPS1710b_A2048 [Burkholderia pseudomallei 1710b]